MKKILLPTDFSTNAQTALNAALSTAKKFDSDIYVLNTYNINIGHYGFFDHLEEKVKDASKNEMKKLKEEILATGFSKEKLHLFTEHGVLSEVVKKMNKQFEFDLLIMGTKGASGMEEVLIGSRTADVISSVKTPVLVVPRNSTEFNFDTITYASDFKHIKSKRLLSPLNDFAKAFDAKINFLRVTKPTDDELSLNKDFNEMGVKYAEWFGKQDHSFHYETNEQVEEGINNFIVKSDTKLLCILARKNGIIRYLFHKSVSKKLTYHTKLPLLIIQE
jgi:nucleotide-binding universal stress UspA family protein